MLEQQCDARPAIHAHAPQAPSIPVGACLDTDLLARAKDELDDAGRHARKLIAQVFVGPRPMDIGPVDEGAAVRQDARADEGPRLGVDDRALPRLEDDRALVLPPGSVLWERTAEMAGIHGDRKAVALAVWHDADRVFRKASR